MSEIKTPFLTVNPKSYLYGDASLELALAADRTAEEIGVPIYFTCPFTDIRMIKERTKHVIVTAQHMDPLVPGRGMGHVLPESLKCAGAEAVFLNHAENPLTLAVLNNTIKRAQELGMKVIAAADSVAEGCAIAKLKPDMLLCEPTDLIGTGQIAGDGYIKEVVAQIRAIDPDIKILVASGVTTADDVYKMIYLGADGTGATSGILNAPDPKVRIQDMAKAVLRAARDREKG